MLEVEIFDHSFGADVPEPSFLTCKGPLKEGKDYCNLFLAVNLLGGQLLDVWLT